MPFHVDLTSKGATLPIIGAVSLTTLVIGGVAIWFLFLRRKTKSITTVKSF